LSGVKRNEKSNNIRYCEESGCLQSDCFQSAKFPGKGGGKHQKKIEQIMKTSQYTPSATARNLSKQASSTVGVIVPEIGNAFFGELFTGIEEVINKNNLSLLYCSNGDKVEKDFEALDMMRMQRVKGVLYVPAMNYPTAGMMGKIQKKLESLGCKGYAGYFPYEY